MREVKTRVERTDMMEIPSEDIQEWKDEICEILQDCENIPVSVCFTNGKIRICYEKEWEDE